MRIALLGIAALGLLGHIGPLQASDSPPPHQLRVDALSVSSLNVEMLFKGKEVGQATGFVVEWAGKPYLVTNKHVVTAENPDTGAKLLDKPPDAVRIRHHAKVLGTWSLQVEPLLAEMKPRWLEHPTNHEVDVVAIPLSVVPQDELTLYPLDYLKLARSQSEAFVGMPVSIIGFPLGLAGPRDFPIWKTGHIASDPDLNFGEKPRFLIDATTRGGMSGSPVILRSFGTYLTAHSSVTTSGVTDKFLGIYSGRLASDSEIGIVWKPEVLSQILERAQ